jgi:hypothetical protein
MCKLAIVKRVKGILLSGILSFIAAKSMAQPVALGRPFQAPQACYFFKPDLGYKPDKEATDKERSYQASFVEVYRVWCTPSHASPEAKVKTVNEMVSKWKLLWDQDPPFNAEFHEIGASDLLELMALTHKLPAQMVRDTGFRQTWIEACKESCLTIWSVPNNRVEEHAVGMLLWLRNDVLDNLKREPASEPVIQMLQDAQFSLVD